MAHVQDRWEKTVGGQRVRTDRHGKGRRWQARYHDADGRERTKGFERKQDAERFLRRDRGAIVPNSGDHFDLVVSTAEDVLPDEYAVAGKAERRRLRDLLRPCFEHVLAIFDPPRPFAGGAGTLEPVGS